MTAAAAADDEQAADVAAELDELRRSIDALRLVVSQVAETQLVYSHNLHCWAHELTVALNRLGGRRFGVQLDPPVFPTASFDGD